MPTDMLQNGPVRLPDRDKAAPSGSRIDHRILVPHFLFPGLIRPAEAEREIRLAGLENFPERAVQFPHTVPEPVVIIAEAFYAIFSGKVCLRFPRFRKTQIVITEFSRDMGEIMPGIAFFRFPEIGPLGKTCAIPEIVAGSRIILRQIKGYETISVHSFFSQ